MPVSWARGLPRDRKKASAPTVRAMGIRGSVWAANRHTAATSRAAAMYVSMVLVRKPRWAKRRRLYMVFQK